VGRPGCLIWLGPQCFSFAWDDAVDPTAAATPIGDAFLRPQCRPLALRIDGAQPPLVARHLDVPDPHDEYLRVPGHPPVGLYRCLPKGAPDADLSELATVVRQ